jgi:hypothetical protein
MHPKRETMTLGDQAPNGSLTKTYDDWRSSELVGATVYNAQGSSIGTVNNLLISSDGNPKCNATHRGSGDRPDERRWHQWQRGCTRDGARCNSLQHWTDQQHAGGRPACVHYGNAESRVQPCPAWGDEGFFDF